MRWIATIMLCLLVMSCTEVIDLRVDDRDPLVTINAVFNNGTLGNKVELTRTSAYDRIVPRPISSAQVRVYRLDGEYISFKEDRENPGVYLIYEQPFLGEEGEEYQLEVVLPTREVYQSAWQKLPYKTAVDHLDFEIGQVIKTTETGQVFEFLGVTIYKETEFLSPDEEVYLKWDVETTWSFREALLPSQFWFWNPKTCYMTTQLEVEEIRIYSSEGLQKSGIPREFLISERIDNTFFGKQFFSLIQSTLNADTYRYWSQIEQVSELKGSIFDPPFGPILGNMQNVDNPEEEVIGYFAVNHVDTARVELNQQVVDVELAQPCKVPLAVQSFPSSWFDRLGAFFLPECLDCLVIPNSSTEKPYFWDD